MSSRAAVGSSMTRIAGSRARALAISTICCPATERSPALASIGMADPSLSSSFRRARLHGGPVEHAAAHRLEPEIDVLGDRTVRQQAQFLVDDADTGAARVDGMGEGHRAAADPERPRVGAVDPAEDLHQRRFAGAVLAADRVNFAGPTIEAHRLQRSHAREALRDLDHFECGDRGQRSTPPGVAGLTRPRCAGVPRAARGGRGASARPS